MAGSKAFRPTIAQQLDAVPMRNQHARVAEDARGATVTAPIAWPLPLRPLVPLMKLRTEKQFRLDGLGLAVWQRIDGVATLGQLVDWMAETHRLSFHEGRTLLMWWLQILMEKGLVVIVGRQPGAGDIAKTAD